MDPSPSSSSSSPAIEPSSGVGAASAAGGSRRRRRRSGGGPPPPPPSAAAAKEGNGVVVWDAAYGNELTDEAPEQEPKRGYFRRARISVLALMKMTLDALSGGLDRKAGYLQGGVVGDAIVVMDSFHVPGFGIEAETESCEEYFHAYTSSAYQAGRFDVLVGWYHSHPGYGCWLSAADVSAQSFFQTHRKQSVAIVIDPMRTVSAGKVEIGAYRTYPHMPPDETVFKYQTIPLDMIGEYSVTRKHYYALGITYFMSSLDSHLLNLLRNKYWANSFFSSSLLANWDCAAEQVSDLAEKLEVAEDQMDHTFLESSWPEKEQEESQLAMIARDSKKIAEEQVHRLILQARKNELFNTFHQLNETMRSLAD